MEYKFLFNISSKWRIHSETLQYLFVSEKRGENICHDGYLFLVFLLQRFHRKLFGRNTGYSNLLMLISHKSINKTIIVTKRTDKNS